MVEIGELAEESVCRSPMNIYYQEGSIDSAHSSGESSRRNSNPFGDIKEFVKRRRNNGAIRKSSLGDGYGSTDYEGHRFRVANRYQPATINTGDDDRFRKASVDSQFYDMEESDDDLPPAHRYQRRFSVPEKVLLNADYAILRPSKERRFEIVAAFDKYTDPYRQYMQSLMCYDLAPSHGAIVLIDSALTMHKALIALNQSAQHAALIIGSGSNTVQGILTTTDCLRAIVVAATEDPLVGERSVKKFIQTYNGRKRLVTAPVHLSVWDASRLFCLNHVHRIPILQVDEGLKETDVLYMLSLRTVFHETILKLVETTYSLAPHVKHRTLQEAGIGSWGNVITTSCNASCGDVIDVFLDGKISCLAVVDDVGKVIGTISKDDIMMELSRHTHNYLDILAVPVKDVFSTPSNAMPQNTIFETIGLLMASKHQCLFVVDPVTELPLAAIAFVDIMDYILNSAEIHHKMSVG